MEIMAPHPQTAFPARGASTPGIPTRCETCGSDCDGGFEVVMDGRAHRFDCFACAVQALAPRCEHCGRGILGHGPGMWGRVLCCDHCADGNRHRPFTGLRPVAENAAAGVENPPGPAGPLPVRTRSIQARAARQNTAHATL